MLKLSRVTNVEMLFLVLVFVLNFDLFKFSAAILEKGLLLNPVVSESYNCLEIASEYMADHNYI